MFAEGDGEVADALTGTVLIPGGDRHVPARQFGAGITEQGDGRAAPFDASLFTHAAMTAGRSSVTVDETQSRAPGWGIAPRWCRPVMGCRPTTLRCSRLASTWPRTGRGCDVG